MDTHKHGTEVNSLYLHVNLTLKRACCKSTLKYISRPHSNDIIANYCSLATFHYSLNPTFKLI